MTLSLSTKLWHGLVISRAQRQVPIFTLRSSVFFVFDRRRKWTNAGERETRGLSADGLFRVDRQQREKNWTELSTDTDTKRTDLHFVTVPLIHVQLSSLQDGVSALGKKNPYAFHPVSQKLPHFALRRKRKKRRKKKRSDIRPVDDGPLSSFQRRSSSAFSFHASLLQTIDGLMFLVLCPQVVSQAPQRFRSWETQVRGMLFPPVDLLGNSDPNNVTNNTQRTTHVGLPQKTRTITIANVDYYAYHWPPGAAPQSRKLRSFYAVRRVPRD